MNMNKIAWFGRYEGFLRMVAKGIKERDETSYGQAARIFDIMLPQGAVVSAMPSHTGRPEQMAGVLLYLADIRKDIILGPMLSCDPHESSYDQKKGGFLPDPFEMRVSMSKRYQKMLTKEGRVYVIDNVVVTGVTANAAISAFGKYGIDAIVTTLAISNWR